MAPAYEDIVIVDLDVQKTTWSRVHSAMRTLYLRLSRDPDLAWNKFFFEERNSRVEVKRHGLWIEDGYIVFDCLLIDVDNHHLPDIRRSIAYANERARELRQAQQDEREQLKAKARDEAEMLKALRANIREERPDSDTDPTALFETPSAPEPDTAHSLEEAAHAQLAPTQPDAEPAVSGHERRLQEFYAAFGSKVVAAPEPPPEPAAPATNEMADRASPETGDAQPPPAVTEATAQATPATTQSDAEAPEPEPPEASELDLESKRNDWRARFRAALERNK
jgi:hypothetical protein